MLFLSFCHKEVEKKDYYSQAYSQISNRIKRYENENQAGRTFKFLIFDSESDCGPEFIEAMKVFFQSSAYAYYIDDFEEHKLNK